MFIEVWRERLPSAQMRIVDFDGQPHFMASTINEQTVFIVTNDINNELNVIFKGLNKRAWGYHTIRIDRVVEENDIGSFLVYRRVGNTLLGTEPERHPIRLINTGPENILKGRITIKSVDTARNIAHMLADAVRL